MLIEDTSAADIQLYEDEGWFISLTSIDMTIYM